MRHLVRTLLVAAVLTTQFLALRAVAQPSAAAQGPTARAQQSAVVTEAAESFPVRVDAIRITGLKRTSHDVVRRELGFKEGDVITKAQFDLAITRLWNMTIFAHVRGRVVTEGTKHTVVLELEDRWTLVPLFSFGSGGGAFFIRLGLTDNNLGGRFLEGYALYENFNGYHGGLGYARDPRVVNQRIELTTQVERLIRPRPGFADQRAALSVELGHLTDSDRMRFAVRGSVFTDRFLLPLDSQPLLPHPTETVLIEPRFRIGRIDTVRVRQRGATLETRPAVGFTSSDVASQYFGLTGEALAFAMLGKRWNFAARVHAANVSRTPAHLQLYAGGLDFVRGFPDNYVRSRALALVNLEARFVAFDSTWVAVIPTVFVDAIAARAPQGVVGTAVSTGGGVRFVIPKFVASGIRTDLAIPMYSTFPPVTLADGVRFGPETPIAHLRTAQVSVGVFQFF